MLDLLRPIDRGIVATFAVINLFLGFQFFGLDDRGTWLEPCWPWAFLAAGVACLLLELRFTSKPWLSLSGGLCVVVYVGRACVVLIAMQQRRLPVDNARAWSGIAIWLGLAASVTYIWHRVLKPMAESNRRRA